MEKYNWTPEEINHLMVVQTLDLEFGEWKRKPKSEPLDAIDTIPGF